MIPENNLKSNIERFSGYADLYDKYRPQTPQTVVAILTEYLGHRPSVVVDLASGTGLSTFIWRDYADKVLGVEPNNDMRDKANESLRKIDNAGNITFTAGYSNKLNVETNTVDIITCSQAFHWMEPESTLKEVNRVLVSNGIFAAYDCDWPPTVNWVIENEYLKLINKAEDIIEQNVKPEVKAKKRNKNEHMKNMIKSNTFRFTKEIVFHNMEKCDSMRYTGLTLSQGGLQTVIKSGITDMDTDIADFSNIVEKFFNGRTIEIMFSYRMRLGVK